MLANQLQPHPLWGRPLDQYARSYTLSASKKASHGSAPRILASTASLQIGELSQKIGLFDSTNITQQVNTATLESILKMAEDVETYQYFLSQRLIGGCIALMQKIKVSGKSSPFSYEYGFLCFRIILFSLGTYLVYRSDNYRLMQQNMVKSPAIEFPLVFSSHVAQVVQQEFQAAAQSLECDSILGWGSSDDHPLASREQVKALVEMLWDDRSDLLKVLTLTYTPGISGLSFLLWRYIYLDAFRDGSQTGKPDVPLIKRITELHFRSMLVATSDQGGPMLGIADDLYELLGITPGEGDKIFPKSQDSQTIFEAYIARLAPSDTRIYAPPNIMFITILLELVVANMGPGLEGLLPSVFEVTTQRFWQASVRQEESKTMLVGSTGMMLEHFKSLLQPASRSSVLSPSVQKDILESFTRNDLLDLVGATLFRLDPDADETSPGYDMNYNLLKTIQTTFDKIGASHTPAVLEETFRDYAPDWLKVQHQFVIRGVCMDLHRDRNEAAKRRKSHYERCHGVWDSIARVLRQKENIEQIEKVAPMLVPNAMQCHIAAFDVKPVIGILEANMIRTATHVSNSLKYLTPPMLKLPSPTY
ncbi:unnamed protein product [Rhizoctonia solani]|uniref:Uncharacterized protein n=1 Tax=Rhizoctonia solani TaxID=456999 RepID=A0A8H3CWD2_9AGAM|nr:unnamed protein product [Rhizoctonia solani]